MCHTPDKEPEQIRLSFDEKGFIYGWNKDKKEDIRKLSDLYSYLAYQSFVYRSKPFIEEIGRNGFFTYNKCKFFPEDKKIICDGKNFIVGESGFWRGEGYVWMNQKKNLNKLD